MAHIIQRALHRLSGLDQLLASYARARASGEPFVSAALNELDVRVEAAAADLRRIPAAGPALVVANHPTGMLDGLALASVLLEVRPDVKILANQRLSAIPELASVLIAVDLSETAAAARANAPRLREAIDHLAGGGMLVMFPAGEVSRFKWSTRRIADRAWHPAVARIIRKAERRNPRLCVLPVHLTGANSFGFQIAAALHPELPLAMLPRELMNKRGARVKVSIGNAIAATKLAAIEDGRECTGYLQWRAELLGHRRAGAAMSTQGAAVMPAADADAIAREIAALPAASRLAESDGLAAYLATAPEIPNALAEIARLREITFRAAGEGTGLACDRDRFDKHYEHLFLWNETKREIAGAYRLARTASVRAEHGLQGLYTATLFSYRDSFLERMGPAIELGRSFVRQEYQRGFAPLLLLWKGIGQYVARHPECKILFGPVSISNQYQSISRELMVAFLEERAPLTEWAGLVASRTPFRPQHRLLELAKARLELEDLSSAIADVEPDGRGLPVLLRQYLKLGGRLLGFNIDPDFANALDGLIVVDLTRTERKLLERYLGRAEAAAILDSHKEAYAA